MRSDSEPQDVAFGVSEFDAFMQALDSTAPGTVSACAGWTAHEIIAHLASGADSFANQVEAYHDQRPIPEFGATEVREPPYQAMDDGALRARLVRAEARMSAGFQTLLDADRSATVPEVGWGFPIASLVTHMRQEFAIHRWDLVGDDDLGLQLLSQPELMAHSVGRLADSLLRLGLSRDPAPGKPLTVRVRSDGSPDLVIDVGGGAGTLKLTAPEDTAGVINADAAARLLLLWGRRPADGRRVQSDLAVPDLARLQAILAGY